MHVKVRLFARLREIAGTSELGIDVADHATVHDVWRALAERHGELGPYTSSVSCAVNEDYSRMTATLREGDEVAFLPPVSGGAAQDHDR